MGAPIDLSVSTEILISIIAISVAAYYLLSKGKTSSQPNIYTRRSITHSTLYPQPSSQTNKHQRLSTSKCDTTAGQHSTDDQSTLFSDSTFDTTSVDMPKQMVVDSQINKESTVGNNSTRLSVEKSSYVMEEAVVPDTTGISSLATREGDWSETEKIDKQTTTDLNVSLLQDSITTTTTSTTTATAANSVVTTKETIAQDMGSNQNVEISQPMITALKDTAHMENQQQGSMDGAKNIVDQIEANGDGEVCAAQTVVDMPVEPSGQQTYIDERTEATEYVYHTEPSRLIRMDDNEETKNPFENSAMEAYDNESATPLDHKKELAPPVYGNQPTTTISAKDPTALSPKRSKQHAKTDNSTTDHAKVHSPPLHHQPHTDSKPKQGMAKLERIGQQRQPYIALYKSRCEFWPGCTNNHCKYYHPFTECRNGNACKFGNKCVFLHPKDYLDHRYPKQTDQAKKKNKGKNKTKTKATCDKLQGNQAKPSEKAVQ